MARNSTAFNDPVHGYIVLEPLLVNIIHTPEFQRMKDIKQLGATYWVYPGASHNRFEHSLGTAHLAGKMIETLRDIHKGEIEITDEEVLCVKIAALCHDLGHGPFSHVFDMQMKEKLKELHPGVSELKDWKHEKASCDMFDHMVKVNRGLKKAFKENKIGKTERNLIKDLINGKVPGEDKVTQMAEVGGKQYPKWFLFEIVANKRNGIDCDKFDYFARDCLNVGVKSNFDHLRHIQNIRVLLVGDELQLCCRDKLVFNIYEMCHTRWSLHHRVYQHKTTKAIEEMITEALALVDDKYKFSEAIFNMDEYAKLTDSIFYEIIRDKNEKENTKKAQEIVRRIQRRELYKFCGETQPSTKLEKNASEIAEEIASYDQSLKPDQLFVSVVPIHFGMKEEDPVKSVVFYDKTFKKVDLRKNIVSQMLPQKFSELYIRVYAKNLKEASITAIGSCFKQWCDNGFDIPGGITSDKDTPKEVTPTKESSQTRVATPTKTPKRPANADQESFRKTKRRI